MSLRRATGFILLFLPLIGFLLVAALPHYAGRLSLLLNGIPFAKVTKDDGSKYPQTGNMRNAGIVISNGRAAGWIYQPMLGFARFVPFTDSPKIEDMIVFDPWFDDRLGFVWYWRWWLLAAQAVVLVLWFGLRTRKVWSSRL